MNKKKTENFVSVLKVLKVEDILLMVTRAHAFACAILNDRFRSFKMRSTGMRTRTNRNLLPAATVLGACVSPAIRYVNLLLDHVGLQYFKNLCSVVLGVNVKVDGL